jgi:hypothetical protein
MRRRLLTAVVLTLALAGCRDAVAPWTPSVETVDTTTALRLTWSAGNDLYPAWSAGGDSVLYVGDGFPGLPPAAGLLLRLSRAGGPASLLIPALQATAVGNQRSFAQPALTTGGERIAFFDLAGVRQEAPLVNPDSCPVLEPVLDSAVLRVRAPVADASFEASVPILFAGIDPMQKIVEPGPYVVRLFPFQREYAATADLVVRPSWAPDGTRLAFSDGLRLLSWTPGAGMPQPIPGTADGVSPAWSPDGQWIAFTRWNRPDSTVTACRIIVGRSTTQQDRWTYTQTDPHIILVHPDGSGSLDVGTGRDPAWGPDGSLYFSNGILRVRSPAGAVSDLSPALDGRWPAVSAAGTHLAFARFDSDTRFDVWVTRIAH